MSVERLRRLPQRIDSQRFPYYGSPTLSFQVDFQHLEPGPWISLNAHTHHSAQVSLCSLDTDCLSSTLENSMLGFGLCLAHVSLCSLKQNLKHPNLMRRFVFRSIGFLKSVMSASASLLLSSSLEFSSTWCSPFQLIYDGCK